MGDFFFGRCVWGVRGGFLGGGEKKDAQKGKDGLPTIHFRWVFAVSFREEGKFRNDHLGV